MTTTAPLTLTATRGLPASGKTTWALEQLAAADAGQLARLNRDDLRLLLHNRAPHTPLTEHQVTLVQHTGIEVLLLAGVSVIVDDTNLRARHLRRLAEIAWRVGAEFAVQDFDISLEECLRRDKARARPVGEVVIHGMHDRYLAGHGLPLPIPVRVDVPVGVLPYEPDPSLPSAVMVDIDGTVALRGDRDPYDPTRYHQDLPNRPVIEAVRAMRHAGHVILFCSGRDDTYREVTRAWLDRHVAVPGQLFMRPAEDRRRDDVVKLELFDKHIRHSYNVICVYDDRDRVVAAWRSIGLAVMQVAEGRF